MELYLFFGMKKVILGVKPQKQTRHDLPDEERKREREKERKREREKERKRERKIKVHMCNSLTRLHLMESPKEREKER